MWRWALGAAAAFGGLVVAIELRRTRRAARQFRAALRRWRETPPDARRTEFIAATAAGRGAAADWYLLGCARLGAGELAAAARDFGMAYHHDPRIVSAALLTFACLKAAARPSGPAAWLMEFCRTWEEMKRPEIGQLPVEAELFAAIARRPAPDRLSPLGRAAWLLAPPDEAEFLSATLADAGPAWMAPLRRD
ncbi:MAG: hypothetical protein U1A27_05760 [Phycisphaerae bacterium]